MAPEQVINLKYLKELDQELNFIPLTFDPVFKGVFGNQTRLLKKFLISVLNLELPEEMCELRILNPELPVENYREYKKTIDFNILLNETILVDIEINREDFEKVKARNNMYLNKKYSMILERGDKIEKLNDMFFYQLNLNTENKSEQIGSQEIVLYNLTKKEIYIENEKAYLKYLEFYYKLYYTNARKMSDDEIWLAALASRSFSELNEILSHILSDQDRMSFMRDVIRMNWNDFNIHEWEKEKCEELVRLESERIDRERREKLEEEIKKKSAELKEMDGQLKDTDKQLKDANKQLKDADKQLKDANKQLKDANQQLSDANQQLKNAEEREQIAKIEVTNTVKNMLKKNFSLEDIQDITGKSMEEIKQIKKDLENDI